MEPLHVRPLTRQTWADAETLFGPKGICGGCWCMWWRKSHKDYELDKGDNNKRGFRALANSENVPGLLFYKKKVPVGWCSLGPREHFSRLTRSRVLSPVDSQPVWSIVCLHVRKEYRHQGMSRNMIGMARNYAVECGANIVEAYPTDPRKPNMPEVFAQTGFKPAFDSNGFVEVERRSKWRPIMRFSVAQK